MSTKRERFFNWLVNYSPDKDDLSEMFWKAYCKGVRDERKRCKTCLYKAKVEEWTVFGHDA